MLLLILLFELTSVTADAAAAPTAVAGPLLRLLDRAELNILRLSLL
jgi:hypothetical protein